MKSLLIFLSVFFFLGFTSSTDDCQTAYGDIEVRIGGIKKMKGVVEVSLFNSKKRWLKNGGSYQKKRVEVDDKDIVVVFENVPYGKYAIVSYHDVNNNEDFDRNWIGIPKEPYAMSKKPKNKFRKPRFKEMSFELKDPRFVVETYFKTF